MSAYALAGGGALVSPGHDGGVTARAVVTVHCWSAEFVVGFCIGHLALPGTGGARKLVRGTESVQLLRRGRGHSPGPTRRRHTCSSSCDDRSITSLVLADGVALVSLPSPRRRCW